MESHAAQLSKVYSHAVFGDVLRMFVSQNISVDVFRTESLRQEIGLSLLYTACVCSRSYACSDWLCLLRACKDKQKAIK